MNSRLLFLLLLLLLAIPAQFNRASADPSYTVTDTNEAGDTVIFSAGGGFTLVSPENVTLGSGAFSPSGKSSLFMSYPVMDTTPITQDTDTAFLTQIFGSDFTPSSTGSTQVEITGTLLTGQHIDLEATIVDSGNGITIIADNNRDLESVILDSRGGTFTFGTPGGGNNNNNDNGGTSTSPPVVPEPSTWAMLLVSFAGLLILQRRRFGRR